MPFRFLTLLTLLLAVACESGPRAPAYVGSDACTECHEDAAGAWQGSHHDLAMQPATPETILGDFEEASFTHAGITTRFFQRDGDYWVETEGPTGAIEEFRVAYTFGVTPLQQYLLELPRGRLQALTVAWDTRAESEGGQRWYHLYPDEIIPPGDELHWTSRNHNWNRACAVCHSTDLRKGYDAEVDAYQTTWSDIDVGCEACHGPGSAHLAWADRNDAYTPGDDVGLVSLRDREATWRFEDTAAIARRSTPPDRIEVETCAPCHSRRVQLVEGHPAGAPFMDGYLPAVLTDPLYFDDGQIDDEVYVYGSFLQSRMYRAGVTCSDCHDPHSLALRAEGNAVCATCHRPDVYDTEDHHGHEATSAGSACVACHMPARTYMGVDDRSDHSMRVPRPDLSVAIGTPNACTACHADRTDAWAVDALAAQGVTFDPRHFGRVFHDARRDAPDGELNLLSLAHQDTAPAIVQATAVEELRAFPSRPVIQVLIRTLDSPDPLVRVSALRTLEMLSPDERFRLAEHRLRDSILAVRSEAGRVLAAASRDRMTQRQSALLDSAVAEYLAIQDLEAEHPVSHVNRGLVFAAQGRITEAEAAYRQALVVDATWIPAYANLADLYRQMRQEAGGEQVLRDGIAAVGEPAPLQHALGLALVRQGRRDEALDQLRLAAEGAPEVARFSYVYAVALQDNERIDLAEAVLDAALQRHPTDGDLLFARATGAAQQGNWAEAERWGLRLKEVEPMRERADVFLDDIRRQRQAPARP